MELIIAGGYPHPYANVAAELKASQSKAWLPTTIDFRATAKGSGGAEEAASFDGLLKLIAKKEKRAIKDLGLIGHANIHTFALSGKVQGDSVVFGTEGMITTASLKARLDQIKGVRDRFVSGATITYYACNAGTAPALLEETSNAFQVLVKGFKNQVWWCFYPSKGGAVRGRTWYDAVGAGIHPQCDSSSFSDDIKVWTPDNKSFTGVQIDM
jgi:hypothetical protein